MSAAVGVSVNPAFAQLGILDKGLKRAQQAKDAKDKLDDLNVTDGIGPDSKKQRELVVRARLDLPA